MSAVRTLDPALVITGLVGIVGVVDYPTTCFQNSESSKALRQSTEVWEMKDVMGPACPDAVGLRTRASHLLCLFLVGRALGLRR